MEYEKIELKKNYQKELKTQRLLLSPWKMDYAQKMFENWASDPEVTKFLTWEPHKDVEVTKQVVSSWLDAQYKWCIRLKETGEPIGSIDIVENSIKDLKCEIGYCLTRKHWNKGIMTEALKKVIEFLFDEGYNKIELRHDVDNPASGRVMQKAGMTYLCIKPKETYTKGKFHDAKIYYILNPKYKDLWEY